MKSAGQRLDPLTSLRFFAAAMIVAHHAVGRGLGPEWPGHFALAQGVSFFFVLSGFVLAYNYPRLGNAAAIKAFYVARFARIWPSHIASALLFVLLIGNISYFSLPAGTRGLITLAHITMTQAWVPISSFIVAYNTVSWSISTEFFFYLAFPLLVTNWSGTWRLKLLCTFGLMCVMWILATRYAIAPDGSDDGRGNLGYINPLARLFEFTLGIGVCYVYRELGPRFTARTTWRRGAAMTMLEIGTVLVVLLSLWLSHQLAVSPTVAAVLTKTASMVFATSGPGMVFFACLIFVFAVGAGAVSRFLKIRPMVFLGEISFGLYLVHTLFLLYRQQAPSVFDGLPNGQVYTMYWIVSLALATLLHLGVERPCQALIKGWYAGAYRAALMSCAKALGGFVLIVVGFLVWQPSTRGPYPPTTAAANVTLLGTPVEFDPGYRLDSVEILRAEDKSPEAIRFAWIAETNVSLNKRIAVHLLDARRKMVRQLDFAMETGYRKAREGERWSNVVPLTGIDMTAVKTLGLAVYDTKGLSPVLPMYRDLTDWNGQRLLVNVDTSHSSEKIKREFTDSFVSEIAASDIVGDWAAGNGVAKVSIFNGGLLLTTETGLKGMGTIDVDRIEVASWNVSGRLTADRQHIRWSNGFVWNKTTAGDGQTR